MLLPAPCCLPAAYLLPLWHQQLGATGLLACLALHGLLLNGCETAISHSMEVHPGWREQVEGEEGEGGGEEVLSAVSQSGQKSEPHGEDEVALLKGRDGAPAGELL